MLIWRQDITLSDRHSELSTITFSFVLSWFIKGLTVVLVDYHDDTKQDNSDFFNRRSSEVLGIILLMFFENIFGRRGCLLNLQILTAVQLLSASVYTHQATRPECIEPLHHAFFRPLAVGHPHRVSAGDTGPAPSSDIGGRPSVRNEKPSFRQSN